MNFSCCVLGLGYIGIPTACVLTKAGHKVIGVDINEDLVKNLNQGISEINEPGLNKALRFAIKDGNFTAKLVPIESEVYIIAVPTPFKNIKNNIPEPNIDYVISAANSITKVMKKNQMILIESTCPVGTTEKIASLIEENTGFSNKEYNIAYCPERVLPGNILSELIKNDRVVGGIKEEDSKKAKNFYKTFCNGEILETNSKTAELVKLTENSFRDVNIAFANELSIICDSLAINVSDLINLANRHPRVNILNPGSGVGGHCIAVDPWFIISQLPKDSKIIRTAREVNNYKSEWIFDKIIKKCEELEKQEERPIKVGCMGITFKANVNDTRESPALKIAHYLSKLENIKLFVCDPNISNNKNFKIYTIDETIKNCDLLVFLVAHDEFRDINFSELKILDYCNIIN